MRDARSCRCRWPVEDVAVRLHDATHLGLPPAADRTGARHEQPLNAIDLEARSSRPSKHSQETLFGISSG